jgi:hypothetical protein
MIMDDLVMDMPIVIQNLSLLCSDHVPKLQKRQDAIYCSSVGSSMQGSLLETVAFVRVCA